MITYQVLACDSWADGEDGWTVNQSFPVGFVNITDDASKEDIIQWFVDNAYLPTMNIVVDYVGEGIYIDNGETGEPLYTLELYDGDSQAPIIGR